MSATAKSSEFLALVGTEEGRRSLQLRARAVALKSRDRDAHLLPGDSQVKNDESDERKFARRSSRIERATARRSRAPAGAPDLDYLGISDPAHPAREQEATPEQAPSCEKPEEIAACHLDPADPDPELQYLARVEIETEGHRRGRAQHHRQQAALAARGLRELVVDGELVTVPRKAPAPLPDPATGQQAPRSPEDEHAALRAHCDNAIKWHRGRERGALERFPRVSDCGAREVHVTCNACGNKHEVPDRCSCPRLCLPCREGARKDRTKRFVSAQERTLGEAQRRGLLRRGRRGGRWGERMMTLTVPHIVADRWEQESLGEAANAYVRIALLFQAWRAFSIRLQKWAREVQRKSKIAQCPPVVWYRGFEWTAAADGEGHPHFHLWIFCPFLDQEDVQRWWRQALAAEGLGERDVRRVDGTIERFDIAHDVLQVDVRGGDDGVRAEVLKGKILVLGEDGRRVQRYIEGWSIIDVVRETGARLPPGVIARVYEALDRRRLIATSPRLLDPRQSGCQECGAVGWTHTEIVDPRARPATSADGASPLEEPMGRPPP